MHAWECWMVAASPGVQGDVGRCLLLALGGSIWQSRSTKSLLLVRVQGTQCRGAAQANQLEYLLS